MSATKNGALQASFQYDPLGRRVVKSTPTKVTTYTYDGADILRESVTAGGITTPSYYLHGPSIDEPLARETAGVMTYFHADGLGSIVKETSSVGAVTNTLRYDAWGNIEAGARDGFAFTGREWDPETGLYYYRARYYDPRAGRFISEDPIGFDAGPNFYSYVGGNPTRFTDPLGLEIFPNGVPQMEIRDGKGTLRILAAATGVGLAGGPAVVAGVIAGGVNALSQLVFLDPEDVSLEEIADTASMGALTAGVCATATKLVTGKPLEAFVRKDPPHHGKGPHVHLGPLEVGPKIPKHTTWPGWKAWIKSFLE